MKKTTTKSGLEFLQAVQNRQIEEIKIMLQNKKKKNTYLQTLDGNGLSPLHLASQNGDNDMINLLVRNEFPLNVRDEIHQWNPVHCALSNGHYQTCILLVCLGCNHLMPTKSGATPLHFVARQESQSKEGVYLQLLKFLLKRNADPNATNNLGESPIHVAAFHGNDVALKFFVSKGAQLNHLTNAQETAIHYAVRGGHISTVKLLIDWNCDLTIVGKFGTPLDVAISTKQEPIIRILEEKTGKLVHTENNLEKLKRIIEHPEFCVIFSQFLERSHSEENLEFYICVEEYKRIKDQIGLNKEGKKIATKFIYPSSESEINIDSAIRDKIVATTEFLVDTFDEAQDFILKLLTTDIYPKFVGSQDYKSYSSGKNVLKNSGEVFHRTPLARVISKHFASKLARNTPRNYSITKIDDLDHKSSTPNGDKNDNLTKPNLIEKIKNEFEKSVSNLRDLKIFKELSIEEFLSLIGDTSAVAIYLSNNDITDKEIPPLFSKLSEISSLRSVDLSFNQISNWGAYRVIDFINANQSISSLSIYSNPLNPSLQNQILNILQCRKISDLNNLLLNNEFSDRQIIVTKLIPYYPLTIDESIPKCSSTTYECKVNGWGSELTIINSNTPKDFDLFESQLNIVQSILMTNVASIFFYNKIQDNIYLFSEPIHRDLNLYSSIQSYTVNNSSVKLFIPAENVIHYSNDILKILNVFTQMNIPLYFFKLNHLFIQPDGRLIYSFTQRDGSFPAKNDFLSFDKINEVEFFLTIFRSLLTLNIDPLLEGNEGEFHKNDDEESKFDANRKILVNTISEIKDYSIFLPLSEIINSNLNLPLIVDLFYSLS